MLKLPGIFFTFTLVLGIFLFDDFGLSADEHIQRDIGNANWNYLLHGDDSWFYGFNQYYGPFVEMIEVLPERVFHLQNLKNIYLTRHFINYFIFWVGSIFFFLLGKEIFRDPRYALLSVLILFLTPRIFAHSFYNSKDLPLLAFFIIDIYFLFRFLKKPSLKLAAVFALVSGMVFCIRISGIMIPVVAVFFCILNLVNKNLPVQSIKYLITSFLLFPVFALLFYPVLWRHPISGLEGVFSIMSHFRYDSPQFFLGELLKPQQLPWYYIPVWMGITIPILWQLLFFVGLISLFIMIIRSVKSFLQTSWQWLLIGGWCLVPWLIVRLLHSTVYDEWRHLFFIYPAFILVAVSAAKMLFEKLKNIQNKFTSVVLRISFLVVFMVQSFSVILFSVTNHPYENVYFNFLAGKNPQQKFDLDYWALSYRQGLEYLIRNAKKDTLKVCWQNSGGSNNLIWLSDTERKRIREVPFGFSEYFLTNFRFHPEQYSDSAWHIIRSDGFAILAIVRKTPEGEKLH